jgi:LacI family transcriptional regulator
MPAEPSYRQLSLYVNPLAADGVILTGHTGEDVVEELSNVLPVVMLDCQKPVPVDNVLVDYCHQGRELTRRLLEAGHRRIAVIAQFPEDVSWTGPLEGYKQALEDAGIEPDLSLVWSKAGKLYPLLLKEILAHEARPTAVFALTTSDHAIILSTLMAMDIEVPGDLGYAGWAYSYMAALLPFPAITCLADIYPSMAGTAVRRVLERVEDPGMPAGQFVARVAIKSGETHLKRN